MNICKCGCGATVRPGQRYIWGHNSRVAPNTHGPAPDQERAAIFWSRVDKAETCWLYTRNPDFFGYGRFYFRGRQLRAHRVAYLLECGPIPDGLCVLHTCDNPPCVRPDHLFLGTRTDNADDKTRKGRVPKGDTHCHAKLTAADVAAIRQEYIPRRVTLRCLAAKYHVAFNTIADVVAGRTWQHLK